MGIRERHAERAEAGETSGPMGQAPEGAEEGLESKRLAEWAEHLVAGLPDHCRAAFRLRQEADMSHEEIARTLNISVKTVEYHLGNARRRLRQAMRP
jgi:RNA polymerase sigma-70 factor (ECF subfamily)